jgi:hypothetical protein
MVYGLQQPLAVCVLSVTERVVSNVLARISVLIGTYKFGAADKTLPPLRVFACQKP